MPEKHSIKNSKFDLTLKRREESVTPVSGEDLALLQRHARRLQANVRYRDVRVPGGFVSVAYIGGSSLSLGVLLRLWQSGTAGWSGTCRKCGGRYVVLGYGGSPLSGSGSGWGVCTDCGASVRLPFNIRHAGEGLRLGGSRPSEENQVASCQQPRQSCLAEWNERAAALEKSVPRTVRRPRTPKKEKRIPSFIEVMDMLRALERQKKS